MRVLRVPAGAMVILAWSVVHGPEVGDQLVGVAVVVIGIVAPLGVPHRLVGGRGGPWFMGTDRWLKALVVSPFVSQRLRPLVHTKNQADLLALKALAEAGDSTGGIVECVVKGVRPGLGDPVFEKLDAEMRRGVDICHRCRPWRPAARIPGSPPGARAGRCS